MDAGREFVKIHDQAVSDLFEELSRVTKKDLPQILRDHAQMLGRYAASYTAPFAGDDGLSNSVRDMGRSAVARDIRRVYVGAGGLWRQIKNSPHPKLAAVFWKAAKTGNYFTVRQIMKKVGSTAVNLDFVPWDNGERHRKARNNRGRVNKRKPYVVIERGAVEGYVKMVQKRVGLTKSGWTNAATQISTRGRTGLLAWISKQPGRGTGIDNSNASTHPSIILINEVPWINTTMSPSLERGAALAVARSLKKGLEAILAKKAVGRK